MNSVDRAIHHVFGLTVTGVLGVWWGRLRVRGAAGGAGVIGGGVERMGVDDSALSSTSFYYSLFCDQE